MNAAPLLGLSFLRANGQPLCADSEVRAEGAQIRLLHAVTIRGRESRFVEAQVDCDIRPGDQLIFEPELRVLESSGLSTPDSLLAVTDRGTVLIPVQNYQGTYVKLREGAVLGVVEPFPTARGPQFLQATLCESACCAKITAEGPDADERNIRLLDALGFSQGDLTAEEFGELKSLLCEFSDVFALESSELGCTDCVQHVIETEDHPLIKQQPYRTRLSTERRLLSLLKRYNNKKSSNCLPVHGLALLSLYPRKMVQIDFVSTTDVSMQ